MSESTNHQLKIHEKPYLDLKSGAKNCEVRDCTDRNFKVGDTVTLCPVDDNGFWKNAWLTRTISHIQTGYGLPDGLCVLSYAPVGQPEEIRRLRGFELAYLAWHEKTDWVQATQQPKEWGMHRADVLKQRIEQLQALSVTHIMIDIVPGLDGMGEEVYAKSVQDVELAMSRYVNEIEELQTKLENAKK